MPEHPEGVTPPDDESDADEPRQIHGELRHSNISAVVPERIGLGKLSNGVLILNGHFEMILDFVLRIGEQQRIVERVILPKQVAFQFSKALEENIVNYETRFGQLPKLPIPKPLVPVDPPPEEDPLSSGETETGSESPKQLPHIQDVYDDLKISDETYSGHYANAVLLRHTGSEFCFDFITNFYPRSAVASRVFMAAPHVGPLLTSLQKSLLPPGTSQDTT